MPLSVEVRSLEGGRGGWPDAAEAAEHGVGGCTVTTAAPWAGRCSGSLEARESEKSSEASAQRMAKVQE